MFGKIQMIFMIKKDYFKQPNIAIEIEKSIFNGKTDYKNVFQLKIRSRFTNIANAVSKLCTWEIQQHS